MAGQYKRIYLGIGTGITTILALFLILQSAGLEIIDLTGDIQCLGTLEDPCISYFNIKNPTAKSIYIYNKENISLEFSPEIKSYQLYVKYYGKWVPMNFTMETRLGNVPKDRLYTFVFPRYSTKEFMLVGYKNNPTDRVKWTFGTLLAELDPLWDSGYVITRVGKRTTISNANYTLIWKLEDQGLSPVDDKVHLQGYLESNFNKVIDFAIITPEKIDTGNFYVSYNWTGDVITRHEYTCAGYDFGWVIPNYQLWCNTTHIDTNTSENISVKNIIDVTPDNYILLANKTIWWNTSKEETMIKTIDLASRKKYINRQTQYGDNIYYINDLSVDADNYYDFEIVLGVDKSILPIKYTITIGNIENQNIWFIYDPIITNSRTWTTTTDFTNGTLLENITSVDDEIKLYDGLQTAILSSEITGAPISGTCKSGVDFDDNTTDRCGSATLTKGAGVTYVTDRPNGDYFGTKAGNFGGSTASTVALGLDNTAYTLPYWWHFWLKMDATNNENYVIENWGGSSFPDRFMIFSFTSGTVGWTYGSTYTGSTITSAYDTDWHMWDFIFVNTSEVKVYKDGQLFSTKTGLNNPNSPASIGGYLPQLGSDLGTAQALDGIMDNFFWASDLAQVPSDDDILLIYGKESTNGLYSDLQGWEGLSLERIYNISIEQDFNVTGVVFLYSTDNSTFTQVQLTNDGSNNITLDLGENELLYYQFLFNDSSVITSYTINGIPVIWNTTIDGSRIWTIESDFLKGTVLDNITVSNDRIEVTIQ